MSLCTQIKMILLAHRHIVALLLLLMSDVHTRSDVFACASCAAGTEFYGMWEPAPAGVSTTTDHLVLDLTANEMRDALSRYSRGGANVQLLITHGVLGTPRYSAYVASSRPGRSE